MGHLHSFDADGVLYETPDGESFGFRRPRDERKARLGEVLPAVRSKMRWDYDFGEWMTTPLTIVNRYPCERHTRLHLDQQLRPDGEIDHDLDQVFAGSLDTDRAEKSLDAAGLRTRCRRTADG